MYVRFCEGVTKQCIEFKLVAVADSCLNDTAVLVLHIAVEFV
jgi:hypothetical protein